MDLNISKNTISEIVRAVKDSFYIESTCICYGVGNGDLKLRDTIDKSISEYFEKIDLNGYKYDGVSDEMHDKEGRVFVFSDADAEKVNLEVKLSYFQPSFDGENGSIHFTFSHENFSEITVPKIVIPLVRDTFSMPGETVPVTKEELRLLENVEDIAALYVNEKASYVHGHLQTKSRLKYGSLSILKFSVSSQHFLYLCFMIIMACLLTVLHEYKSLSYSDMVKDDGLLGMSVRSKLARVIVVLLVPSITVGLVMYWTYVLKMATVGEVFWVIWIQFALMFVSVISLCLYLVFMIHNDRELGDLLERAEE